MKSYIKVQEDESDCGACCLFSIIEYYNGYVPLDIIKLDTLTTNNGTSFYNLKAAATKYGFDSVGNKVDTLPNNFPLIAQLKIKEGLYHFVVVYKLSNKHITCMDPSIGIRKFDSKEFYKLFTGYVLQFYPIGKIVTYEKNNYFKGLIIKMVKKNIIKLFFTLIISIMLVFISLYNTYNIKLIFNYYSFKYLLLIGIFSLFKNVLSYIKNYLLAHLNKNNNINLINDYITQIFFLPFKYLQLNRNGELLSRINDLNNIKDFLTKELINALMSILTLIGLIITLYSLNKNLTYTFILLSSIYLGITFLINKKSFNLYLNVLDSESDFLNQITEYICKIKTIKNLHKENYFLNKLKDKINYNYDKHFNLDKHLNNLSIISSLFSDIGLFIVLIISLFNSESLDNVLVYILYYNMFIDNINYYALLMPEYMYFKSVYNKVSGIYSLKDSFKLQENEFINGDIKISNLKYQNSLKPIFNNYNNYIKKGDKVLLIGQNGSGKSTLLNILNNNITDYQGDIKINNVSIRNIKLLKNNVYLSYQEDELFTDTILNNIILDQKYNERKFKIIEDILCLKDIISKKQNGYTALIKDNLSGGERQRIILARALYQDASILLLDESLSDVSYSLRNQIIKNINKYYQDKTIIYVSHFYEDYNFAKIINLTARKEKGYVKR